MTVYYYFCQFLQFQLHHNQLPKYVCAQNHSTTTPQFLDEYLSHTHIYVDQNLLVGVMTSRSLHCTVFTPLSSRAEPPIGGAARSLYDIQTSPSGRVSSEIPAVTQVVKGHAGNTAVATVYLRWVQHGQINSRTGVPAGYYY